MDFWLGAFLVVAGFAAGLFLGGKYLQVVDTEYSIGKVKVRGNQNDITTNLPVLETPTEKKGLFKRIKLKRSERRNIQ